MTKLELLEKLKELIVDSPSEERHIEADGLLLEYIDDPEISTVYNAISKWYA